MASIPNRSVPNRLTPHPGEFLREMLEELGISQTTFHERTGMSMQRISEIVNGKRGISPETAWILGGSFGQTMVHVVLRSHNFFEHTHFFLRVYQFASALYRPNAATG